MKAGRRIGFAHWTTPDIYPPVINAARVLLEEGWQVDLVCFYRGRELTADYGEGVNVIRLDAPSEGMPRTGIGRLIDLWQFRGRLLRIARERKWIAVMGHNAYAFWASHRVARQLGFPSIYHCHDILLPKRGASLARLAHRFECRFAREADLVICPDPERGEFLASVLGLHASPLIVPNCPIEPVHSGSARLQEFLASRQCSGMRAVVRHGSMGDASAMLETVRSMGMWPKGSVLVHIGPVTQPYWNRLLNEATRLGIGNRVLHHPAVPSTELLDLCSGAHVGHAIYKDDPDPNFRYCGWSSSKLFDYMACGVPFVQRHIKTLERIVRQYHAGIFVNPDDPSSIGSGIGGLLEDDRRRELMGENARKAIQYEFNYRLQYRPVVQWLGALTE